MPNRSRMSSVDTAWLRMDRPTNRMVIVGVWLFDQAVDYDRLLATFAARFMHFDRFRCRPVEDMTPLLAREDNADTSPPAPPEGLYFVSAEYPAEAFADHPGDAA